MTNEREGGIKYEIRDETSETPYNPANFWKAQADQWRETARRLNTEIGTLETQTETRIANLLACIDNLKMCGSCIHWQSGYPHFDCTHPEGPPMGGINNDYSQAFRAPGCHCEKWEIREPKDL